MQKKLSKPLFFLGYLREVAAWYRWLITHFLRVGKFWPTCFTLKVSFNISKNTSLFHVLYCLSPFFSNLIQFFLQPTTSLTSKPLRGQVILKTAIKRSSVTMTTYKGTYSRKKNLAGCCQRLPAFWRFPLVMW